MAREVPVPSYEFAELRQKPLGNFRKQVVAGVPVEPPAGNQPAFDENAVRIAGDRLGGGLVDVMLTMAADRDHEAGQHEGQQIAEQDRHRSRREISSGDKPCAACNRDEPDAMNQGDAKQAGTAQKTLGRAIRGRFLAKPGDLEQIRNDHRAAKQHQHEGFRRHPVELAIRIGILSQIGMVLQMIALLNFKIGDKQRAQDPPAQNVIDALAGAQVPMPGLVV